MTFCVLGAGCCVFDRTTQSPGIAHGDATICTGCDNRIRADLNRLRFDYIDLSQAIPKSDVRNDEAHIFRPKPESSPPMNMAAFNLRAQIVYFVGIVALVVRRGLQMPATPNRRMTREGFGLDHDLRFLVPRAQAVAGLAPTEHYWRDDGFVLATMDGPQVVAELTVLHRRARQLCGLEPRTIRLPGMCPHCEVPGLHRFDDDKDRIWCMRCSRTMSADEYAGFMQMRIADPT